MYEKINEPIDVLVKFLTIDKTAHGTSDIGGGNKVMPMIIRWRGKNYKIEKINMVHKEKQGNDKIYYFSVSDNANFFRLAFNTRDLSWKIEELFCE